ncbi:uncharacterized protein LOC129909280 isoform X2 [Episyrphus balteatus]|uniref:uncharacterized protein LOC129909280 isoform X2 n=1 Tax=Episyrphus balteatus TaxID=286459 RepID=UPI0024852553|nr:uncharacterized protein LOC129909280 isoform X2 [Episyrphus balteatus]XP_055842331.1 uncharacterized protein LOC129909280 isoform X2 [Episyrphus balteatus]
MDDFLSQLDINPNANLDELPKQFASVMLFMQIDRHIEPNANEIRMFLRAALFLHGNLEIHGQTLEQKLKEYQQIKKTELNSILTKFHDGSLLDDVCERLLMTETGPNHILEIQTFCNDFLDPIRYLNILRRAQDIRCKESNIDEIAAEAKFLITTTFQLKTPRDIDTAIKRLLDNVNFDTLAWIINFNEPNTYFFMKCLIIQKEICSGLEHGLISENFIASMYEVSSQDETGLSTYIKCLQNKYFANSLMVFCINYLTAIGNRSLEVDKPDIMKHDLLHVSFLIAGMLSSKSECRVEFHKKLAAMSP